MKNGFYLVPNFTADYLRSIMDYDQETGGFVRKVDVAPNARAGSKLGNKTSAGYIQICVKSKLYVAHRLAWYWVTGEWPEAEIDHINRCRSDNRWSNLRAATRSQNMMNKGHARKYDLPRGVSQAGRRFQAQIKVGGKFKHIGMFATADAAHAAWIEAARERDAQFIPSIAL